MCVCVCVCVCAAITSLYSIIWLVFVTEMECVDCTIWTESLGPLAVHWPDKTKQI